MASDANWVEDVRRWYEASRAARPGDRPAVADEVESELGYEAANPSLQAAHWPDTQAMIKDLPQ